MTAAPKPWDGIPDHPERKGWHWVGDDQFAAPWRWLGDQTDPFPWRCNLCEQMGLASAAWRGYLGPIPSPAELADQRRLAKAAHAWRNAMFSVEEARLAGNVDDWSKAELRLQSAEFVLRQAVDALPSQQVRP